MTADMAKARTEHLLALYYGYAAAAAIADAPPTPDALDVLSNSLALLAPESSQPLEPWSAVDHTRWFIPNSREPVAPLFEGYYRDNARNVLMEELLRFYQHFELKISSEDCGRLPDELPLQLECMQYLVWRELAASTDSAEQGAAQAYARARREFTTRHLGYLDQIIVRLQQDPSAIMACAAFSAIRALTQMT